MLIITWVTNFNESKIEVMKGNGVEKDVYVKDPSKGIVPHLPRFQQPEWSSLSNTRKINKPIILKLCY